MEKPDEGAPLFRDDEEEESDTEEEEDLEDLDRRRRIAWVKENIEKPRKEGDKQRTQFLATACLQPPQVFRVIDIKSTCNRGHVTLLDYQNAQISACGYSAISHTFGLEVYSIFDCQCACENSNATIPPRCWDRPCPHNAIGECKDQRDRVVNDILRMCHILNKAGVAYAWHDGVCIAQHDGKELIATIESMGWIYSTANETIVFLHYVGKPMAPISPRGSGYELVCRWHTRVWTLQEAALSKKRRYCVRVCNPPLRFYPFYRSCRTLKKFVKKMKAFEDTIALWYSAESSEIDVITEERFMSDFIQEAEHVAWQLRMAAQRLKANHILWSSSNDALGLDGWYACITSWCSCLARLKATVQLTCLGFPTFGAALADCSKRDSKHVGDRINSVLTLAGVKGFVSPKDFPKGNDTMEGRSIEFFDRQGQGGLALALFSMNVGDPKADDGMLSTHTWAPMLWRPIREPGIARISECTRSWGIKFKVCQDRRLRVEGELECVALRFTLKLKEGKSISPAKHLDETMSLGGKDPLGDDMLIVEENPDKAYTYSDQDSIGEKYEEEDVDFVTDELCADEANTEMYTDQQVSELEVDDESMSEEDEEEDDELEVLAHYVKTTDTLDLELNASVEGFIDTFLVRFLDTDMIMGAATFFPVQLNEGANLYQIGECEIKEGESFNAYLVAPLHYVKKKECLIVQGNIDDDVSKIGIFTMFTKLTRIFQTETGKAVDHPAYKIVEELVIQ